MSARTPVPVTVRTAAGVVRGRVADGLAVFRGIPYAAAPVGEWRFRAPEPTPGWEGVREAVAMGPTAPMLGYPPPLDRLLPNPIIPGDEYLNLTVWTPEPGAGTLPVLVWIHGGAFVHGSSAVSVTDGSAFARAGIVTVAINYRLGVEGFALLPDAPPNLGLLDQIAALKWVRDNVAAFGGDPDAVTVAGQSAGAMCIGALLAMPRAAGLFRRAVLHSGAAHQSLPPATAARVAGYLAAELGVTATADALRALPVERVIGAQQALFRRLRAAPDPNRWGEVALSRRPFAPVTDGDVLPDAPWRCIAAGSAAEVDVLVGSNRHEHRLFLVPGGVAERTTAHALAALAASYGLSADALNGYRSANPGASPGMLMAELMTDWSYRIPALRLAEAHPGSHVYEFGWETPVGGLGACHMLEVPFVFRTLDDPAAAALLGPQPPAALADAMHHAWTSFVTHGDPGWPVYTKDRRATARFGTGADPGVELVDDPRGELRKLWVGIR